jgi:hypothetical protein
MTPIEEAKQRALIEIDLAAGTMRLKHITTVYGQEQVYIEKSNEAVDYMAEHFPEDVTNYPFIEAESKSLNITTKEAAVNILKAKSKWVVSMAAIERERLRGKYQIHKAPDISTILKIEKDTIEILKQL